jgi:hypothetical protein
MQLNPMHVKISALFTGRLFRIPEYQRAYAWGTRQRSDLFNDILDVRRSGREHFMATVVALARTQDIRLIGADEYRTVEIVDGQQRITTLVVLLKAIEKALNQSDSKEEKLRREIAELLVKDDDHSLVLLQTNHDSSSVFTDYIRMGEINAAQAFTAADFNVVCAADECEAFVKRWSEDKPLIELVATIRNQLSVIYHEISDEATVYRVFEVLNSRGLDVKWIDKLKSQLMALLFEHVEGGTRTEAVREMQVIWQDIYRTLGVRGDLGDEALRFAGTWTLTSRPNRIIGQEDAAAELAKAAGTKLQTIMAMASRLKAVVQAVDILDNNVRLRAVTKIAHARFVATAILLRKFDPDVRDRLLGRWERVTFRIFGLGGADTRHKVGDYVRLGYQIFTGNIGPDVIDDGLVALGKDWDLGTVISGPDYWSNCYEGWGEELRYLLFRYDEHLATSNGSSLNTSQWNKIWTDEPARSIEHIQPQSTEVSYMHHLGNLTMLPPRVNSSLQDKPPADKAATYRTSGLLATMAVGETINGGTTWDEAAVRSRASQIEDFVRREWGD